VAEGVTTTIVLFGEKLNLLDFSPGHDTIAFGSGISIVPGSIVVSPDGKKITLKIKVDPGAALGLRSVTITDNPSGQQLTLADEFIVNPPPTVTSAGVDTGGEGLSPLLSPPTGDVLRSQTLIVNGSGFQAPTTVPSNLMVSVSGTGITVNSVGFAGANRLAVNVDVAKGAQTVPQRTVTVINPDLGTTTSGPVLAIALGPADAPVGLAPTSTTGTATLPPGPTVTSITTTPATTPPSALTGASIKINGTKFSATLANNLVTFARANNLRATATITAATASVLTVTVPATAVDGPVIVAVSGVQQTTTPFNFTVNNPTLARATVNDAPAGGKRGSQVSLVLTGTKFRTGATVSFSPSVGVTTVGTAIVTATQITVPVNIPASAALGPLDITVKNTDNSTATLPQSFEVKLNSALDVALSLECVSGCPTGVAVGQQVTPAAFLPTLDSVQVTLDTTGTTGTCTARTITPTIYLLKANVTGTGTLPDSLTFKLTSSNRPGTSTNDDCEPNLALVPAQPAAFDFSVGDVGVTPQNSEQQLATAFGAGLYQVWFASWDWGGTVHIDVADNLAQATVGASLNLPVNGIADTTAKTVLDGLTNFEKYRGVYLVAPPKGSTGPLQGFVRLDPSMRNLFVRGRGFSTDPTLPSGSCGLNSSTGAPVPADQPPALPCPKFQFGNAFAEVGVKVWDVSSSFTGTPNAPTTVFPTKSLADPTKPMLDLATVTYDAANCSGGAVCDHTTKLGPRQWNFPTLGFSTFGSATTYGTALVLRRPFKAYFLDRPYLHQENLAGAFLPTRPGERPMLAPPTIVCDKVGADDGTVQAGECTVGNVPAGDVYRPGQFNLDMSSMDVNSDSCVELPFVGDPTTLTACDPNADFADQSTPQSTFQQLSMFITSHELLHAAGVNVHTSDATDLMYMYSINWSLLRAGHLSPQSGALVQIHNKGKQ
jgi:hypothetical protein